jgi:hypothetical protein
MVEKENKREKKSKVSSLLDNEDDDESDSLGYNQFQEKVLNKKFNFYDDMDELGVEKPFQVSGN